MKEGNGKADGFAEVDGNGPKTKPLKVIEDDGALEGLSGFRRD